MRTLLYVLGYLLPAITIILLFVGLVQHFWVRANTSPKNVRTYLFFLFCLECLSLFYSIFGNGENIFLFGLAPFINLFFFLKIQKSFIENIAKSLSYVLMIASIPTAILFYSFSSNKEGFQGYSLLICGAIIVLISAFYTYFIVSGRFPIDKNTLRFNYAALLFFSMDVFLSIPSNFLINASVLIVWVFWIIRWLLLVNFYVSLIKFKTQ